MSRIPLALVAVIAVVIGMLTPSFAVRAQGTTRFEYARLAPYADVFRTATLVDQRPSYRACIARTGGWTCRDFKATESTTDALRNAFLQLGNDGWELVSAAQEDRNVVVDGALTYLFKRPVR